MKTIITFKKFRLLAFAILTITSGMLYGQPNFRQYEITNQFTHGMDVFVEDINGDGHKDILGVADMNGGEVAWWENDGFQQFNLKHVIIQNFQGARSARAIDLDGDEDIDIIAAAWIANKILWWENDGDENWAMHAVDTNFVGAHTVDIKDMNDDGYLDVLCSGFDYYGKEGEIAWWKNDGSENFTKMLISERFQQSPFIYGEDMDGDEDLDIIACGELNGELYWWENLGNDAFEEHMIDDAFSGAHTVLARDVDGDNDMDILGAACIGARMVWWENKGYNDFEKNDLGVFAGALWLDAADMDLDGDIDLVGGGMGMPRIAVWYNNGSNDFTRYFFPDVFSSIFCVIPTDLDNDTDIDVVGIGYNSNMVAWSMNQMINPDFIDAPESVAYDHEHSRYLVSCINADAIVAMDKETRQQELFIEGIESPLGNCIHDGVIYVSTGTTLKGFNLDSRQEVFSINIPCIQHLDGMTCDNSGNLYVIDTGGKIHKVDLSTSETECIVASGLTNAVQDCIFDPFHNRLLSVAWTPLAPIQAIDLETFEVTTATSTSFGYFDGISIDQFGNVYVASHITPGKIIRYDADFSGYEVISQGHSEPAGLDFNTYDNILAVPNFSGDKVDFIQVQTIGIKEMNNKENPIKVYPNPNDGRFMMKLEILITENTDISITNTSGREVLHKAITQNNKDAIYNFDLSKSPGGVYFINIYSNGIHFSKKIIIK